MPPKRVTIHDVARHAGVSHTTVSWVIHDDPRISPATKKKVHQAIGDLKYHPNHVARSLVKGTTNTIAILSSFYSSAFEIEILKGVETGFEATGSTMSVLQFTTRDKPQKKIEALEQIIYGRRADALICMNLDLDEDVLDSFAASHIPIVLVEGMHPLVSCVRADSHGGALAATAHLLDRGRQRVAFVGGNPDQRDQSWSTVERLKGWRQAHEERDRGAPEDLVFPLSHYYFEEGSRILDPLLEAGADAVFCAAGDMVAMGILAAARDKGVRIPEDLALVGYDDLISSRLVKPSLSTVAQDLEYMGSEALRLCLAALADPDARVEHRIIPTELRIRESS